MILFMRNLMGLLLLAPMLLRSLDLLATAHLHLHLLRALLGLGSMACLYYSWSSLPLGQAALLKQTAPFFIPLVAWWWLGEGVPRRVRLALLIGFAGVALILKPQQGDVHVALLIGLAGAALGAGAKVTVRRMHLTEPPRRIVLLLLPVRYPAGGSAGGAVLGHPGCHWVGSGCWVWGRPPPLPSCSLPGPMDWCRRLSLDPSPMLRWVVAALLGWWLWDERIGSITVLGMLLVFAGGVLTLSQQGRTSAAAGHRADPAA